MKKTLKVIFDTNVLVSFLIGKRLSKIKKHIENSDLKIVLSLQLLREIEEVTSREKLQKYFPAESVAELLKLLDTVGETYQNYPKHFINRDSKDNFLLDLIDISKADYLVTGDKDLLEHHPFLTASILTPTDFENEIENF